MKMHSVVVLLWSYLFTAISCVIVMTSEIVTLPSSYDPTKGRITYRSK